MSSACCYRGSIAEIFAGGNVTNTSVPSTNGVRLNVYHEAAVEFRTATAIALSIAVLGDDEFGIATEKLFSAIFAI